MYEAPIHLIFDDIKIQLDKNVEDCVYSAVQNVGVNVDRDELIRALKYDREQYSSGYRDGQAEVLVSLIEQILEVYPEEIKYIDGIIGMIKERIGNLGITPLLWKSVHPELTTAEALYETLKELRCCE